MINKENEYNKGIFDLLNKDFKESTDDEAILNLIKKMFLTDIDDINNEDVVEDLLKENITVEDEQAIDDEASSGPLKKILFTEVDYINNGDKVKKTPKDE